MTAVFYQISLQDMKVSYLVLFLTKSVFSVNIFVRHFGKTLIQVVRYLNYFNNIVCGILANLLARYKIIFFSLSRALRFSCIN